jgi:hypothetical protein
MNWTNRNWRETLENRGTVTIRVGREGVLVHQGLVHHPRDLNHLPPRTPVPDRRVDSAMVIQIQSI